MKMRADVLAGSRLGRTDALHGGELDGLIVGDLARRDIPRPRSAPA